MSVPDSDSARIARLEKDLERLQRTNGALMDRIERGMASGSSAFAVFEHNANLEALVEQRTRDLVAAKNLTESQNRKLEQQAVELQDARAATEAAMEQLKRASLEVERAAQSKSEFLANMSHEIRTPMTAILGFTDHLLDPDLPEAEQRDAAQTIRRNGDHLLQIINDILDISKIEAGKLSTERIHCSPIEIVGDVKTLMQMRAEDKKLALQIEYAWPIPERIESDPTRLKQILVNLLGNSIKFTERGSIRLVIRCRQEDAARTIMTFETIDTGIGLTQEQIAGLFRPFAQADSSTTRRFGGTGLGLTISKRLAEMLGGDITVTSEFGQGSNFCLAIDAGNLDGVPRLDGLTTGTTLEKPAEAGQKPPPEKLNCRILLAEDGPDNQRLIAFVLKKAGAEVTIVKNGKLALDAVLAAMHARRAGDPTHPFDVILMDMQMPVMDGYEATGLLRQKGYTGPIIALTAHAMATDRQKCLDVGCDDYANKPIDRAKLIETIRQQVRKESASLMERGQFSLSATSGEARQESAIGPSPTYELLLRRGMP